jgi:RHS repeat-associated protein
MRNKLAVAVALATVSFSCTLAAQVLGTGAYPFASFDNRVFDSINLGNLNTRFSIPITQKAGRGLPFSYVIQYEGLVWTPVTVTGTPTTTTWVPSSSWGFTGVLDGTNLAGFVTNQTRTVTCGSGGARGSAPSEQVAYNYVFHDGAGANHPFSYQYTSECSNGSGGSTTSGSTVASDGSGHTLLNSGTQILTARGTIITPGTAPNTPTATSEVDSNGNTITFGGASGIFTDTLGTTALTVTGTSPVTFTYPVVNQSNGVTQESATLYYRSYTVQTNFNCAGIVEYGSTTTNLVDHITLADSSVYSFTYEKTLGVTNGAVTGRLASVTLPTGGTISYAYNGGCTNAGGSATGIMSDGSTAGLSRTTADSSNSRTYTRATVNTNASQTTLQDEKGNQTLFQFTAYGGDYYETHRQVYQGAVGGTPLLERLICYNSDTAPCDGVALTAQITATRITTDNNGGSQQITNNGYDTYGNLLSTSQYSGSTLLESTTNSYNSLSELVSSTTTDASGNFVSKLGYGYDQTTPTATSGIPQHVAVSGTRGNPTSFMPYLTSTYSLRSTIAYYDTGMPLSTTTLNGTTSFGYDSTQTFITQTTLPTPSSGVSLSTSATYDPTSGAMLNATGMNSAQTTTLNSYDSRMRPTKLTLPNTGQVTISYGLNQTNFIENLNTNTGENAFGSVIYDAYGRSSRKEVANGQTTNGYYQADTCYDSAGLTAFQSVLYQSTGSGSIECSGAGTSYVYDALGRPITITTNDGSTTAVYNNRAVETTDVNGVQKITQYDVLGRITGVCEITSTALNGVSPTACGMDISGTGFVTSYAYVLATHTTTVTQGTQTRTFVTDALGRTTSVIEPERGTTTYAYSYNSSGLSVVRTRPRANQTSSSVTTTTTSQYDSLGRLVSVNYSDGTPGIGYGYDSGASGGWPNNSSLTYVKGQLAATGTGAVNAPSWTGQEFSYDIMGNVTNMWQCTATTCGTASLQLGRPLSFAYDLGGNMTQLTDVQSGTINYGRSSAGEITSITNATFNDAQDPPSIMSNVVNGPFGPISYTLGSGLDALKVYDALGRNYGGFLCAGSTSYSCAGGSQIYGGAVTFKGSQVTGGCESVLDQCQSNYYDALNRLISINDTSHNTGDIGSFNYTYDRFGNRLSQTVTSGSGPSPSYSFNAANNQIVGLSYDAAGNLLNDGYHSYTYDAEGDLLTVDAGSTGTYVYDAQHHRVSIKTGTGTAETIFDASGRPISVWASGSLTPVAGRIYAGANQIAYRPSSGGTFYDFQDYLGTERLRTSWTGSVVATYQSLPWGDGYKPSVSESKWDQNNEHFAGLQHDSESDTEHAQFRQLSSTQGRWMSPDPYDGSYSIADPQSLNRYAYASNSPLNEIDPSGMCPPPGRDGKTQPCGGDSEGDDGTIDGIDEFDFLSIPVSAWDYGEFPGQSYSNTYTNQYGQTETVSWSIPSFGWGYQPIGTGSDLIAGWVPTGGSSGLNNAGAGGAGAPKKGSIIKSILKIDELFFFPNIPTCSSLANAAKYSGRAAGAGTAYSLVEAGTGIGLPAAGVTGTASAVVGTYSFVAELESAFGVGCN